MPFDRGVRKSSYCSRECAYAQRVEKMAVHPGQTPEERTAARYRVKGYRRRALLADVPHDAYTIQEIAERDGYQCQLCGLPVDMAATGRDKPSIDHIVPLSRGGTDEIQNVELAHFGCNSSKGNREEES